MSTCPHLNVRMGGISVPCLVVTGSMVSTVTESFFSNNFEPWGQERLQTCQWLQLRAANGLEIPYLGYLELDVELCGKVIYHCGILVVKDPPGDMLSAVPGVLGMNVISKCYQELFGQHGSSLFDLPLVSKAPSPVVRALQQCHQSVIKPASEGAGRVTVRGTKPCRIPGGTMKWVAATCSDWYSDADVLFEPSESGLPNGLLTSSALVQVIRRTVYIQVVNVGTNDSVLYPRTRLGQVSVVGIVSLAKGVSEVRSIAATVGSPSVPPAIEDRIQELNLSPLTDVEQGQVRTLLQKYHSVFSMYDGDLGCTNLISHDIPLLDQVPVK